MVHGPSVNELIHARYLVPPVVYGRSSVARVEAESAQPPVPRGKRHANPAKHGKPSDKGDGVKAEETPPLGAMPLLCAATARHCAAHDL